ncbi:hypothetical protein ACWGOQ_0017655 [Aquimarina sp. M1]
MRALSLITLFLLLFSSCIPTKIAPNIKEDKVMVAKKFKKGLPKRNSFIFEDPKNANEFYQYINNKFKLTNKDVGWNVPFFVNKVEYYLSFHEVERTTNTINLAPMVIDAALENQEMSPVLEDSYFSRNGKWYIVLTVNDKGFKDCLKENYAQRDEIVVFLRQLRKEYLSTSNYKSLLFKK